MDKYMKFILTIIAVGIIGINFHLLGGEIISKANAHHYVNSIQQFKNHIWIDNWLPVSFSRVYLRFLCSFFVSV